MGPVTALYEARIHDGLLQDDEAQREVDRLIARQEKRLEELA